MNTQSNAKKLQKETVQKEITEAEKIASSAKDAVIEFATQRDLAATIAAEEKALRGIEEMGDVGAIAGIHGRLRNLIKIDKSFKKAIDAAATGWLDALVVKDIDIAFTCMETLRRMKLGQNQNYSTSRRNQHKKQGAAKTRRHSWDPFPAS